MCSIFFAASSAIPARGARRRIGVLFRLDWVAWLHQPAYKRDTQGIQFLHGQYVYVQAEAGGGRQKAPQRAQK
ncbi:hypothetical protein L209DRAFT_751664 [Thermothelomyces heterothallicus CBS 203.75]